MLILVCTVAFVVWAIPVLLLCPAMFYEWKSADDTVLSLLQVQAMVLLWPLTTVCLVLWLTVDNFRRRAGRK